LNSLLNHGSGMVLQLDSKFQFVSVNLKKYRNMQIIPCASFRFNQPQAAAEKFSLSEFAEISRAICSFNTLSNSTRDLAIVDPSNTR